METPRHHFLIFFSLLAACTVAEPVENPVDNPVDNPDTDTGEDTDTDPNAAARQLDWRLHDDHESLVYVSWLQKAAGEITIEYNLDGQWVSIPTHDGVEGENEALVVGIPYDTDADWRLTTSGGEVFDGDTITTGDLSSGFPLPTVVSGDSGKWLPGGSYYLGSLTESDGNYWDGRDFWTFIIDREGRVVWANLTPSQNWTLFAQVSVSGDHILWDEQTFWSDYDNGAASTVHRTYLDAEIEVIGTPGLQHSFNELPDGTLAWMSSYHGGSYNESLVERAPGATDVEVVWACGSWGARDGCASNGQFYVADTDSYLLSFYSNESIVEVSRSTGENLWWAGARRGGYSFDPPSAQFAWQHGISYTDAGTLLVSTHNENSTSTIVREYAVDHKERTLTEVWSFDPEIFGAYNGDAWRLDNGNTLHTVGSAGRVKEATADGEVAWDVNFGGHRLMGRGELIADLYSLVSP